MPSQIRDTFLGFIYTHRMKPVNDTTREALNILVVAALCFPDVLKHARDEVDAICSSPAQRDSDSESEVRLPTLADMNRMPYICATAKELLRWRPIFPLTPDHALSAPISFEGYHFPAGTGFVINEVPVCSECDEPGEFKPERWLDGNEADIAHGLRQFGGGRHICVWYRLAQRSLFVNVARLVQPFDYESTGPYDSKQLNHHLTDEPFPVKDTARSKIYESLILEETRRLGVLEDAKRSL